MNRLRWKYHRTRLEGEAYKNLHEQIILRDNWRCQCCGSMNELQVHHICFRSHLGEDREENLIALCAHCHRRQH